MASLQSINHEAGSSVSRSDPRYKLRPPTLVRINPFCGVQSAFLDLNILNLVIVAAPSMQHIWCTTMHETTRVLKLKKLRLKRSKSVCRLGYF